MTKERAYNSLTEKMFCPACHKQVLSPFQGQEVKIMGPIKLGCGSCGKGRVIIKPHKQEDGI